METLCKVADGIHSSKAVNRVERCPPQHREFKDEVRREYHKRYSKVSFHSKIKSSHKFKNFRTRIYNINPKRIN